MNPKTQRVFRELIGAAKAMRDATNTLWHAYHPEDGPENTIALSVEDAETLHSDAFSRLERTEYYAEKSLAARDETP